MIDNILLHLKDGNRIFTREELINEAKRQEAEGIQPHYIFYGKNTADHITPPGWLVFSTWDDGCGVVHKHDNGNYHIVTGWQGEFLYI